MTKREFDSMEEKRRKWLFDICEFLRVVGASHEDVVKAIGMTDFKDFEDCLQDRCAEGIGADYIITRNAKDFCCSIVPAVSPEEFLEATSDKSASDKTVTIGAAIGVEWQRLMETVKKVIWQWQLKMDEVVEEYPAVGRVFLFCALGSIILAGGYIDMLLLETMTVD